jgi:hypothetical protein
MNRKFITGLVALAVVCLTTSLGAQLYVISMESGTAFPGGSVVLDSVLDNNGGAIAGWSYGVCDAPEITASSVGLADCATVKNGSAADFNERATFPGGWTQGVVICFTGCATVAAGAQDFVMADVTYNVDAGAAPGSYAHTYCNTLGTPPVSTVVVVSGQSITPDQNGGAIEVQEDPCAGSDFSYIAPNVGPINYPAASGLGGVSFGANFSIADNLVGTPCPPDVTQGFSMGCSNNAAIISPTSTATTLPFAPDFAEDGIFPNGWTIGVVYSFVGANTLTFPAPDEVITVTYEGVAGALSGVEGATATQLIWDSGLGSPPVANVVVVGGGSIGAVLQDGVVGLNGTTTQPFVAADCNGDGITNIADIIWLLSELFQGGPTRNCLIACDANGNGIVDVADAVYIANYVFLSGPPPAGSLSCDTVPGQTPEDCEQDNCS